MTRPCKDCSHRKVGCHSICKTYMDWKEELDAHNQAMREAKHSEDDFTAFSITEYRKNMKRRNKYG